jgi:hypothetical protein
MLLLALLTGTEKYIQYLFNTIPGINAVHVWVDYSSTGGDPMTQAELAQLAAWPGAVTVIPSVNQFVRVSEKSKRETVISLFSTQPGDPEVARLPLSKGTLTVDPEGWDVIVPLRVAKEINNFNPEGLVGKTITLKLPRYSKTADLDNATPSEVWEYPLRVVGLVESSPEERVYGSINMVRFVRDFATGRSEYMAKASEKVDVSQISARTMNENVRVQFRTPAAAETAFLTMRTRLADRFELGWPGQRMMYLRDVETVSTIVLVGIGLLAVVAGAVSIFNTLMASVARKSKEIGILRALGVQRLDVFVIFIVQALLVGAMACVLGLLVAGLATGPLNAFTKLRWEKEMSEAVNVTGGLFLFSAPTALFLIVAVLAICLLAAFLPSLRASGKTPMDALREQ